jgi:hypothetical protein
MVRLVSGLVLGIAVCAFTAFSSAADEPKEVTIEGKIGCGKCDLKESAKCAVVVYTTAKDGKKTVYWLDAAAHKKYHGEVCTETKPGTVTGTVKKEGEKNVITVKELKFK